MATAPDTNTIARFTGLPVYYRVSDNPENRYVDDRDRTVIINRRERDGHHAIDFCDAGSVQVMSIPGFFVDGGWLWSSPFPSSRDGLEAILAGPPPF